MDKAGSNKLSISLKDALDCLKKEDLLLFDIEIEEDSDLNLVWDSRSHSESSLFIAIDGVSFDSHSQVESILGDPNSCAIIEKIDDSISEDKKFRTLPVKNSRLALSKLLAKIYNHPDQDMVIIGITGTNGKSTTAFLLESILSESSNTGLISTIYNSYSSSDEGNIIEESSHTTEDAHSLMKTFSKMRDSGVQKVVMEVSSHALDQYRVDGLTFSAGVFTNLTQDHLDYHHTMEEYYLSKRRFFLDLLSINKPIVICSDTKWGAELKGDLHSFHRSYAFKTSETMTVLDNSLNGIKGAFHWRGKGMEITSSLFGDFNIENICAAAIMAIELGIPGRDIEAGLRKCTAIPGRLEKVENSKNLNIIIDYAHTPDALEKVLETLKPLTKGKLITVFGCGGDRDQDKRSKMASIAEKFSDTVVLTTDNPRTEDPKSIIFDIKSGFTSDFIGSDNLIEENDRKLAIKKAISLLSPDDALLIAGKGHENTQITRDPSDSQKTITTEFNDAQITKELLG
jgi:UDP-N-acetylmuramyl-tripeptide synthetase